MTGLKTSRPVEEDVMASSEENLKLRASSEEDLKLMKDRAADKREFKIDARKLNITNSNTPGHWQWKTAGNGLEVAKAVSMKWIEVKGSFLTTDLRPDRRYKVYFVTRMEETDSEAENMGGQVVSLKLLLPNGTFQERQAKLPPVNSEKESELEVGQFTMTGPNAGTMRFAMERLCPLWSGGLVIEGAVIKAV